MSQASSIFRANSNSSYFNSLKARSSASNQNGCKLLYLSETNYCETARSKVITQSSNNPAYGAKIVFELPNYGHLSELFLKTTFKKSDVAQNASHSEFLTENAGFFQFQTAKLVSDGVEIARLTPEYLCAYYYKHCNDSKRRHLQQLIHGWKNQAASGSDLKALKFNIPRIKS